MTLNIYPDAGEKGDTVEYGYHYADGDSDFREGREWRRVKADIALCIEADKAGKLHDDIEWIEKVWHDDRTEQAWVGYATVWTKSAKTGSDEQ